MITVKKTNTAQLEKQDKVSKSAFRQLTIATFAALVLDLAIFMVAISLIHERSHALLVTLVAIAASGVIIYMVAMYDGASIIWFYLLSQLALSGMVFSAMGGWYIGGEFWLGAIAYGFLASFFIYLALSDRIVQAKVKDYLALHLMMLIVIFFLALKFVR